MRKRLLIIVLMVAIFIVAASSLGLLLALDVSPVLNLIALLTTEPGQAGEGSIPLPKLDLILPSGWAVSEETRTVGSSRLLITNQEGDYAVVLVAEVRQPDEFISEYAQRSRQLLELSSVYVTEYTYARDSYEVHALDAQGQGFVIKQRMWYCPGSRLVYMVKLNTSVEDLPRSQVLLDSIGCSNGG